MKRRWPTWLPWLLRGVGFLCLCSWLVPMQGYEATEFSERATLGLGWPTQWYISQVEIEANLGIEGADWKLRRKPLRHRGPKGIWLVKEGQVENVPNPPKGELIINSATRKKRSKLFVIYGPLGLTVAGIGCFYIAGKMWWHNEALIAVKEQPLPPAAS